PVYARASVGQMLLDGGLSVLHRRLGLLLDALHRLPELGKLALAHRLVELSAEFGRLALDDANVLADGTQQRRQILGADDEQRHEAKDQQFAGGKVEPRLTSGARSQASLARAALARASVSRPSVYPSECFSSQCLPEPVLARTSACPNQRCRASGRGDDRRLRTPIRSWRPTRPCWAPRPTVARWACRPRLPKPWAARPSWRAPPPRPCPSSSLFC